ncbi:hypothetical protein BRE01_39670 [Brevibacillus reuszeri]|uniref:Uncharacterized protein n=1 Tax=Brevibacillus reuszeri TaxID=54915 RepID=A0A0K9YVI3_9BACL|nr:hypothetical protein [Brevibacillus reuszeri]KNB72703.1 hypothetical protein ADS79_12720 [Brevibacillus reuszeri]MED1860597.1 hypothetical protein [Brevibacillus reuszeri]GED70265.1 hypothetical protein BRE01_39670 [Brevibacillus reuszeri]
MLFSVGKDHLVIRHDNEAEILIEWEDIYVVSYYQIDCINSVLGYLAFDLTYGETIEINDNVENWEQVVEDLEKYLPSQVNDWRASLRNWSIHDDELLIYQKE